MFMLPAIFIVLVVGALALVAARRHFAAPDPRYGVGALAARLGFQIIEGNPDENLLQVPSPQLFRFQLPFVRGAWRGLKAQLVGTVQGRSAVICILDQHALERGLLGRFIHTQYDGHIAAEVRAPFPAFEVISRTQHAMMAADSKLAAPIVSFGDAQLDAVAILRSHDPRIAPVIREAVRSMLAVQWFCIRGEPGRVVFDTKPFTKTMLFDAAEPVLTSLALTASALELAAAQHTQVAA